MALLSFRGISTPSLQAQGEQRRPPYFNIGRDNSRADGEHAQFSGRRGGVRCEEGNTRETQVAQNGTHDAPPSESEALFQDDAIDVQHHPGVELAPMPIFWTQIDLDEFGDLIDRVWIADFL